MGLPSIKHQGHPTDRFGKLSVRKALKKMSFRLPKKGQLRFSKKKYDLRFSGNGQKCPSNFEKTQVPLE